MMDYSSESEKATTKRKLSDSDDEESTESFYNPRKQQKVKHYQSPQKDNNSNTPKSKINTPNFEKPSNNEIPFSMVFSEDENDQQEENQKSEKEKSISNTRSCDSDDLIAMMNSPTPLTIRSAPASKIKPSTKETSSSISVRLKDTPNQFNSTPMTQIRGFDSNNTSVNKKGIKNNNSSTTTPVENRIIQSDRRKRKSPSSEFNLKTPQLHAPLANESHQLSSGIRSIENETSGVDSIDRIRSYSITDSDIKKSLNNRLMEEKWGKNEKMQLLENGNNLETLNNNGNNGNTRFKVLMIFLIGVLMVIGIIGLSSENREIAVKTYKNSPKIIRKLMNYASSPQQIQPKQSELEKTVDNLQNELLSLKDEVSKKELKSKEKKKKEPVTKTKVETINNSTNMGQLTKGVGKLHRLVKHEENEKKSLNGDFNTRLKKLEKEEENQLNPEEIINHDNKLQSSISAAVRNKVEKIQKSIITNTTVNESDDEPLPNLDSFSIGELDQPEWDYALTPLGGEVVTHKQRSLFDNRVLTSTPYHPIGSNAGSRGSFWKKLIFGESARAKRRRLSVVETTVNSYVPPELGHCFSFNGDNGLVTIVFESPISVRNVELIHVLLDDKIEGFKDSELSDVGKIYNIDSTPRNLTILGWSADPRKIRNKDQYLYYLGEFLFDFEKVKLNTLDEEAEVKLAQSFKMPYNDVVDQRLVPPLRAITLQVLSNYGNEDFTCIYRVKAIGSLANGNKPPININISYQKQ